MERELVKQSKWSRTLMVALGVIIGTLILNDVRAQELENSLLWEVEGKGIKKSYVYGTFHMLPQEDFELKEKVTKAFDASEQVVLELDMDNPNMQAEMMQNIAMKEGKTLDQFLSEEDLEILNEQLQAAAGLTAAQVNTFKPFMVETFILPTFIEGTPASYEMTFVQRSMNQEKEILGLETVPEQVAFFDEIPYADQAEDLIDILKNRDNMESLFDFMIKTYKEEDISELYDASVDYFSELELNLLLHKRNQNWIPKIGEMAQEKSTFFAVGAGHLGGDQGVINLLKKAGYSVKPVEPLND